jgi:hypothetical protein
LARKYTTRIRIVPIVEDSKKKLIGSMLPVCPPIQWPSAQTTMIPPASATKA